jgi:hypothetical protein
MSCRCAAFWSAPHCLPTCPHQPLVSLPNPTQAREYLHWQLRGVQHTTPVAIMTSGAKGNHWRVAQLFEGAAWFGRGASSFRLFQQPLVPMVAAQDGRWLLQRPLQVCAGGAGLCVVHTRACVQGRDASAACLHATRCHLLCL